MQIDDKIEKELIRKQERKEEISNSPWKCNHNPTLITLHDQYLIFEDEKSETIIFYKDILVMKRDIQVVDVHAIPNDYSYFYYEITIKTAIGDFNIEPNNETPPSFESSIEPYVLTDDLYSEIIDKMVENK